MTSPFRPRPEPASLEVYLAAAPVAVSEARRFVRNQLGLWHLDGPDARDLPDNAALVTSELVTNAVNAYGSLTNGHHARHGQAATREVGLRLRLTQPSLFIDVWDAHPAAPNPRQADVLDVSGRGLALVSALAAAWDWYTCGPPATGKVTWAQLTIPAELSRRVVAPKQAPPRPDRVQPNHVSPRRGATRCAAQM